MEPNTTSSHVTTEHVHSWGKPYDLRGDGFVEQCLTCEQIRPFAGTHTPSNHQRVWIAMKGNEESLRLAEADGWEVHEVAKAPTTNSPEDIRQSMDLLQQIHRDSLPDTAEITSLRAQLSAAHRAQRTAEAETAKAMAAHALDIRDRSLPVETTDVDKRLCDEYSRGWHDGFSSAEDGPLAAARQDLAYYNGAQQAAAMAHQSVRAMDKWIAGGCGKRRGEAKRKLAGSSVEPTPECTCDNYTRLTCPLHGTPDRSRPEKAWDVMRANNEHGVDRVPVSEEADHGK